MALAVRAGARGGAPHGPLRHAVRLPLLPVAAPVLLPPALSAVRSALLLRPARKLLPLLGSARERSAQLSLSPTTVKTQQFTIVATPVNTHSSRLQNARVNM